MNPGAHFIFARFPEFETARKVLYEVAPSDWIPTIPDGPYQTDGWRVIKIVTGGTRTEFVQRHPDIGRVLDYFKDPIVMAVYYSMLPGAVLHAHRDLSGTLELGRIRFHIPIATDPAVNFMVARKRVPMKVGEMWGLNTSYLHAVENNSPIDRIHLVVEVEARDWSWSMLPRKTSRYYCHFAWFLCLVAWRGFTKVVTDRNALSTYRRMSKFLVQRVLGQRVGHRP